MKIVHNTTGDTIVEVLFSILIISLILSGAFVTSNTSLLNIRAAQERQQALGIAQGQVETLRAEASNVFVNNGLPGPYQTYIQPATPPTFCFDSTNTIQPTTSSSCDYCFDSANNLNQSCPAPNKFSVSIQSLGQISNGTPTTTDCSTANCISTYGFKVVIKWVSISPNTTYNSTTLGKTNITIFYRVSIS